jgi:hypothetical protein
MANRDTHVMALCKELEVSKSVLYAHVTPQGELMARGAALLAKH